LAKEVVTEAEYRKVLTKSGAWIYLPYDQSRKFQGRDNLIQHLRDNEDDYMEFRDWLNEDLNDPEEYEYVNNTETEENDE
jgi:hypothetical protein